MRAGLIQLNSSDDPVANLPRTQGLVAEAVEQGAQFVATPEVTNVLSTSRSHQKSVLQHEAQDQTLAALCKQAADLNIWLLIGSLGLLTNDADGRFANRSFLIDPQGNIKARYDKIHMFDVQVTESETYRESDGYRPGETAVLAETPFGNIGMSICYDMRFPYLYRQLAKAGATILTAPAAFSPVTGAAHWHSLLRARAIENGCFVIAPAQTGAHSISRGKPRSTYGHSLVVDPWGEVLLDAGEEEGAYLVDMDLEMVGDARKRVPSLDHDRPFQLDRG
ncbi:carbon-nitrogen hydrolase family protein [Neptunicoccus cionae]|uniref:carbon-nitrogen hydrolase family protein n=1 Tax=Neptunicoccus cionae TaxID=2035344 RepID=UPI000C762A26|nr:carbon-nitrogen hydrolase family protein [Amylibacter cionae]PLS23642.1 amidohydrolase [Amylibacter cionae]